MPEGLRDRLPPPYVYKSDGLATVHHSPFLYDPEFAAAYARVEERWGPRVLDLRWRVFILSQCALHCRRLRGSFAEFGVYRGASAYMVLRVTGVPEGRKFYLFDTFQGIPSSRLTKTEEETGFSGRLSNTSAAEVESLLDEWQREVALVEGDLFETLPRHDTGPLAFVHLDLNAAAPTLLALAYSYDKVVKGGLFVFDDYGWRGYEDQRSEIDEFLRDKPERLIPLPTGQALLVKL